MLKPFLLVDLMILAINPELADTMLVTKDQLPEKIHLS